MREVEGVFWSEVVGAGRVRRQVDCFEKLGHLVGWRYAGCRRRSGRCKRGALGVIALRAHRLDDALEMLQLFLERVLQDFGVCDLLLEVLAALL